MSQAGKTSSNWMSSATVFHLQQAFKLALSMTLFYWLALWMNWDVPKYGGLAIVIISLGTTGATIEKGLMRLLGTTVGVLVGFIILALFCHDRWATLLAFVFYITLTGYFMQISRYPYAWYVAAFIPLVIWGDNYPNFESAFYFGTFRYLNTAVGVLIYTLVDLVFWPRHAGDQLKSLGRDLFIEFRDQFSNYRRQWEEGLQTGGEAALRAKLAGTLSQATGTLQQAHLDTPMVIGQKRLWKVWRTEVRGLAESMELWRQSFEHCREYEPGKLLPSLRQDLDRLQARFERLATLWQEIDSEEKFSESGDRLLMESLTQDLDRELFNNLPHLGRAALVNFLRQFESLDRSSGEILRTMRGLAGREPAVGQKDTSEANETLKASSWDPARLISALYPPVVFFVAFVLWIYLNPPTGPSVAMFAGIVSILVLQTRMNPQSLLFAQLLSLMFVVAPVYWLVMPSLNSGFGLLGLIFVFCFVFGFLGGFSPVLKSGPIIMFVVSTGISNQQKYSFQGLVDASVMLLLAGVIVMAVFYLFVPMRPERGVLNSLRRFFRGCAGFAAGFTPENTAKVSAGDRRRKRFLETMVLPAPAKIESARQALDYALYPDNTPDKVEQLHDNLQSIAYRLESLQSAHERMSRNYPNSAIPLVPLLRQTMDTIQGVFQRWAEFTPGDVFQQHRSTLEQLSHELQSQLADLQQEGDGETISDELLADIYALWGCLGGVIEAMANTQTTINRINWTQWATPRF